MRFDCDNSKKCKCEARGYFIGNYKKACSVQKTDLRKPGPRKKIDCWQWENENVLYKIEGVLMFLIFLIQIKGSMQNSVVVLVNGRCEIRNIRNWSKSANPDLSNSCPGIQWLSRSPGTVKEDKSYKQYAFSHNLWIPFFIKYARLSLSRESFINIISKQIAGFGKLKQSKELSF